MNNPPVTGYPVPPAQSNPNPNPNANGYPPPQYSNYPAAGAAYPYNVQAPPAHNGYYNAPYATPRATFFSRFVVALIAVFIIIGTILFIVWLVLRPRVPEFRVDTLAVTGFNLSASSQVTGTWNIGFTVANPNKKMSVSYDEIESTLYYQYDFLAVTTMPPFGQGTRNVTNITVTFTASQAYVDVPVARDLSAARSRGMVSFALKLLARVSFKDGAWRPRARILRVLCGDLAVTFTSNGGSGKLASGPRECRVAV